MKKSHLNFLIFALVLLADQLTKALSLAMVADKPVTVLPFFNWVLVWNPGISFGLLNNGHDYAPWLLSGFSLLVVTGLVIWLKKTTHQPLRFAIIIVIAGAIGNIIDRLRFGAVVDFLDFHAFGYHWPAFNIADSAIVMGIAYILADSLLFEPQRNKTENGCDPDGKVKT